MRLLLAEDEKSLSRAVTVLLRKSNYEVDSVYDGEEALAYLSSGNYDGAILDIMMPKLDGWQVCREIRQYSKVPIIMLTARSDERDELLGFELGVDEYISKPFSPKILVARVEAILRRTNTLAAEEILKAGVIEVNKAAHQVLVDGKNVELSYKEFELLTYFVENQGIC